MTGLRVVVLGGTGFVGSAVADRFVRAGATVRSVSRGGAASVSGVDVVAADLTRPGAVARAVAGADVIASLVLYTGSGSYRVGAEQAEAAAEVNVEVAHAVSGAVGSGGGPTVLWAGSTSQVGAGAGERISVDGSEPDRPTTEYDRQKCAAEAHVLGAGGISLRLPTVYGRSPGGLDRGVVTAMIRRAVAGQALTVWGEGGMLRDLVAVDDVARAFVTAAAHAPRLAGRKWVLGSDRGVSVRDLFERIAHAVAAHANRAPVPVVSVPPPAHATDMDLRGLVADPSAFRAVTGWRTDVDLDDGLAETVRAAAPDGTVRDP